MYLHYKQIILIIGEQKKNVNNNLPTQKLYRKNDKVGFGKFYVVAAYVTEKTGFFHTKCVL
jgi:hypothetical protein